MEAFKDHAPSHASGDSDGATGLTSTEHRRIGEVLIRARRDRNRVSSLVARYPELTLADASRIRDVTVMGRLVAGEKCIGVTAADYGGLRLAWLTDGMLVGSENLDLGAFIGPRLQAKLVLTLAVPVVKPVATIEALLAVTSRIHVGLEIVDSRYQAAGSEVDARDALADNCSAAALVLSHDALVASAARLARITGELCIRYGAGQAIRTTVTPAKTTLESLVWVVDRALREGARLEAGTVVATVGLHRPAQLGAGARVTCVLHGIGQAGLSTASSTADRTLALQTVPEHRSAEARPGHERR